MAYCIILKGCQKGEWGWKENVVPSAPAHPLRVTVARALPQDFGEVPPAPLLPGSFEDWHEERGHWLCWDFFIFLLKENKENQKRS